MVDKTKKALSILESRRRVNKSGIGGRGMTNTGPLTTSTSGQFTGHGTAAVPRCSGGSSSLSFPGTIEFNGTASMSNNGTGSSSRTPTFAAACSSSSASGHTGATATALVPSPCSRTNGFLVTPFGGSFAPLSSSSSSAPAPATGSSACSVPYGTHVLVGHKTQLSPPPGQQSLLHSRTSSPRTSSSSSAPLHNFNNSSLLTAGHGAAAAAAAASLHSSFGTFFCFFDADLADLIISSDPMEMKRQAAIAAEVKANETLTVERARMEQLLIEAKRKTAEELMTIMNKQEDTSVTCWNCGRAANETCSGCNQARYCGSFCQHKHWDIHHRTCGRSGGQSSKSPNSVS